ncbi:MAG: MBL fold metallo-hydrolase [Acidobacteriota bacterium]|nr:MBL fold metallo-hydrolase [Acidobacteriota bacterium]
MKLHPFVSLLITAALCAFAGAHAQDAPAPVPEPFTGADYETPPGSDPYLVVLGVAQDAGYPQLGCDRDCCRAVRAGQRESRSVVSLGMVDPASKRFWLFEATPDFPAQYDRLRSLAPPGSTFGGVFLTHAHIGHYTGLMYLGREALGAQGAPVYAMPRMADFLRNNGPWSQLVELGNIRLEKLAVLANVTLGEDLVVRPFLVPHRDEFSETVAFEIHGPHRTVVFLPDIDKWSRWGGSLPLLLDRIDRAYIDATFYHPDELPGRDMSEIPHPYVPETMALLQSLPPEDKAKVHFIHFNHTNPLLDPESEAAEEVRERGFEVAREGDVVGL